MYTILFANIEKPLIAAALALNFFYPHFDFVYLKQALVIGVTNYIVKNFLKYFHLIKSICLINKNFRNFIEVVPEDKCFKNFFF